MISVDDALARVFDLITPLDTETVPLRHAAGRVLAEPVRASRAQPPFDASAMDGYAIDGGAARPGARFDVIGENAAGHVSDLAVGSGQALRIFTGAPLPRGADRVIIQEDVTREGNRITLGQSLDGGPHIRPAGADFPAGHEHFPGARLSASDLVLIAAMNVPEVKVRRRPEVALIATGDELVMPGETPRADQITASNIFGLAAMVDAAGGLARILPIARDTEAALGSVFDMAAGSDLIVTIGGASVGDHDLVGKVAANRGLERAFYKIAMRPGKPLMAGRLDGVPMLGLPGNPVSAMVCGHVFLLPAVRAMLDLGRAPAPRAMAPLAQALDANGAREHYMRATLRAGSLHVANSQDSALTGILAASNALILRPPNDPPRAARETVTYLAI
ncbi:molybdopterin molybdotransferase MoeA [Oceaniglobus indicus]|uniref:molybdopterin molybdotransferase MoeA n=1 Tax=Oceaniglobus indicus TaxID=2047749 RepID=UPI000C1A074F|nr:molybdopterin molybdotransferase MoeA [Oceaniglobus indicus]